MHNQPHGELVVELVVRLVYLQHDLYWPHYSLLEQKNKVKLKALGDRCLLSHHQ